MKRAEDASTTKYILIQSLGRLSPSQRQKLETEGLKHFDYVSKNIYLCYYQPKDLDKIRGMEPIVYADIYYAAFKTVPNLKEPVSNRDYRVDVMFHTGVQSGSNTPKVLSWNSLKMCHFHQKPSLDPQISKLRTG